MRDDKLIDLDAYRARIDRQSNPEARRLSRASEGEGLLAKLRQKKRLPKTDGATIARNLGRMIADIDRGSAPALAKRILKDKYEKRRRYVEFSGESEAGRYASSGGDFARVIQDLSLEKKQRGFDSSNAMVDTVYEALLGTSLLPPSRFRMPDGASDEVYMREALDKVLVDLAQSSGLSQYFELVSKYPIVPSDEKHCLELKADREPNDLYRWDGFADEDEFQNWIPWWAPKSVIGHIYIPFNCKQAKLSPEGVGELKQACNGDITENNWKRNECSWLVETHLVDEDRYAERRTWHRLPVWMVVLPSPTGLVPCLYCSIWHWDELQIWRSVADETYTSYYNSITPKFVRAIGETLDTDLVYFQSDDDHQYYVCPSGDTVAVIGSELDPEIENFADHAWGTAWSVDEVPVWLHAHPVQQLLKLSSNSIPARLFALSPRVFVSNLEFRRRRWGIDDSETVFRPAFSDPMTQFVPPIRQNTIGAYLLRNFVDSVEVGIYQMLKKDVLAKAAATRSLIEGEISRFQDMFAGRYGQ
jgi:hypothetical protein